MRLYEGRTLLLKMYGAVLKSAKGRYGPAECIDLYKRSVEGKPANEDVSPSDVERQNLAMQMIRSRFMRLTNAFSNTVANHIHMLCLYFVHYNFCRTQKRLRVTGPMAEGVIGELRESELIISVIDARSAAGSARPLQENKYKLRHYPAAASLARGADGR